MPEINPPHILRIKRQDYELMRLDVADRSPEEACGLLEDNQVRRLPVVDDGDRCVGMISIADVSRFAPRRTTAKVVERVSEPSIAASAAAR